MDRTLSAVLAVLVVALVVFLAVFSFSAYVGIRYRATLLSTYEYRVSIATDEILGNVTFYLPIPAMGSGTSAILEAIGAGKLAGVPGGWNISLIGTQKITMLEVKAGQITPTPPGEPYLLSVMARVPGPIMTMNPGSGDLLLAPSAARGPAVCPGTDGGASPDRRCGLYESPVYADFTSPGNVHLGIFVSLVGKNAWDVFGPSSNEYQDGLQVSFSETLQGWRRGSGMLVTGIGDHGLDPWLPGGGASGARDQAAGQRVRLTAGAGEGTA
jgi:hypothetical protein